jgi:predicted RNase H-like nuclease (RuvC/YqgF family)
MTNQDYCKTHTNPDYKHYVDMCEAIEEVPLPFTEWQETNLNIQQGPVNAKYQEHVNTVPNPLTEETFVRMQVDVVETAEVVKLRVDLQNTVDNYEGQKASLWQKIDEIRKDNRALRAELEEYMDTCRQLETELDEAVEANRTLSAEGERWKNSCIGLNTSLPVEYRRTLVEGGHLTDLGQRTTDDLERKLSEALEERGHWRDSYLVLETKNNEAWAAVDEIQCKLDAIGQRTTPANQPLYPHYFREVPLNTTHVDISWVLRAWSVPCCEGHAVKKLMAAGQRGAKDKIKDLKEARDSINRALELEETR